MRDHAFELVGDAALAYRNHLSNERNLVDWNIQTIKEAKKYYDAICAAGNKKYTKRKNHAAEKQCVSR